MTVKRICLSHCVDLSSHMTVKATGLILKLAAIFSRLHGFTLNVVNM